MESQNFAIVKQQKCYGIQFLSLVHIKGIMHEYIS